MSSDAEAQKAIQQLNGQDLKGRALKVKRGRWIRATIAAVATSRGGRR